ncbi:hypothetical protein WDW86_19820 [Bdellovibrionota bacterium FG-2]
MKVSLKDVRIVTRINKGLLKTKLRISQLRQQMAAKNIADIALLPEERPSKHPTTEQLALRIELQHSISKLETKFENSIAQVESKLTIVESKLTIGMGTMLAASIAILTAIQKLV